jgi:hypothetical protein
MGVPQPSWRRILGPAALAIAIACAALLTTAAVDATARDGTSRGHAQGKHHKRHKHHKRQTRCTRSSRKHSRRSSRKHSRRSSRKQSRSRRRHASRRHASQRTRARASAVTRHRKRRRHTRRRHCATSKRAPAPAPVAAPATPAPPAPVPGNGFFAPTSPWNVGLDPAAPLDPHSATRVAALSAVIAAAAARNSPSVVNVGTYSTPLYVVDGSTPRVPVQLDHAGAPALRGVFASGVPIPAGAIASHGSDAHMTIYQPSTDTLWEFWQATPQADGWHAVWGGAIRGVSANPGYFSDAAWPGAGAEGWMWGASASGLPVAAGLITAADLRAGVIAHAVAAAIPNACKSLFMWPAQRTDGTSTSGDCIPEGARLRLDPAVNVDALRVSPIARMIARAAQRYGIIVRDVTNSNVAFFAEHPATAGAALYGAAGPAGTVDYRSLAGFPWGQLQMLAGRMCGKRPCGP